jgi:hypothetical protein
MHWMAQGLLREASWLDRRRWLQVAGIGWLGAAIEPRFGRSTANASEARTSLDSLPIKPLKSCILVFYYGGPSHLDTYDPKPHAPAEIRSQYGVIATSVPGMQLTEPLSRHARIMHHLALVRSMHHPMRNHNSAASEALTGRTPQGGDLELLADEARAFPTLGSAVSFGLGERAHVLPYVALPYTIYNVVQIPGQTPGFLDAQYDRFQVSSDPSSPDFRVPALEPPEGRSTAALASRRELLRGLDSPGSAEGPSRMRAYQERVFELLSSDAVRRSFDLRQEEAKLRERYGRNRLGQSLLLARRLVESGVNFVTVFDGHANAQEVNWDSHQTIFPRHRVLLEPADRGFSALIEDLAARGLLDSTLVVAMGEFGRTPKINSSAGRDHWPDCYTVVLAGGGIRGGTIYGASDKIGAYPARDAVTPADLAATIFWRFGIDPAREIRDQTARPIPLSSGQPLEALFA